LIGDGVLPANEGRGYVCGSSCAGGSTRRMLGFTQPFLAKVAQTVIDTMGCTTTN